jgi:hypothetical protein
VREAGEGKVSEESGGKTAASGLGIPGETELTPSAVA